MRNSGAAHLKNAMVLFFYVFPLEHSPSPAPAPSDNTPHLLTSPFIRWLAVYGGLTAGVILVALMRSSLFFWISMVAATRMHNSMVVRMLRAPLAFFHTNPAGRVLNRFSNDQVSALHKPNHAPGKCVHKCSGDDGTCVHSSRNQMNCAGACLHGFARKCGCEGVLTSTLRLSRGLANLKPSKGRHTSDGLRSDGFVQSNAVAKHHADTVAAGSC